MTQTQLIIHVFLYRITPKIWRRISLPETSTFRELHEAIQDAMGWEAKYPHEFRHGKGKNLKDVIGPNGLQEITPGDFQDETQVTLKQFIGRQRLPLRLLYRYDFTDEWIHEVVFEKREDSELAGPVLLGGERACPPEAFGGVFYMMQALAGDIPWARANYDPEVFDPKQVKFGITAKKTRSSRKK